jgi:hypothetical protein
MERLDKGARNVQDVQTLPQNLPNVKPSLPNLGVYHSNLYLSRINA